MITGLGPETHTGLLSDRENGGELPRDNRRTKQVVRDDGVNLRMTKVVTGLTTGGRQRG